MYLKFYATKGNNILILFRKSSLKLKIFIIKTIIERFSVFLANRKAVWSFIKFEFEEFSFLALVIFRHLASTMRQSFVYAFAYYF